jgi:hypothetical protein
MIDVGAVVEEHHKHEQWVVVVAGEHPVLLTNSGMHEQAHLRNGVVQGAQKVDRLVGVVDKARV